MPDNSSIIADCCDGTPDMGCRYDALDEMWCFHFNETENKNIYVGYPISNVSKLSYYGQRESITITAFSATNNSLKNDSLQLNATIGGSYVSRENDSFQGRGVHVSSLYKEIGMVPWMSPYKTFNITSFEQISVFNNGSDNETIELSLSDLPERWKVEIWNTTQVISNITLSPQELVNLTLIITAPSNLAEILVEITARAGLIENETQWAFKNKYLYETKTVFYQILSTTDEALIISEDLNSSHEEPYWYEEYGRYWYLASAENIQPNNESVITLSLSANIPSSESTFVINPLFIVLLALIVIAIIVILILKKIDFFGEKDSLQSKKTTSEKTKTEQKKIEKKDESKKKEKEIKELEGQKQKVLSSIKRVETEFKEGIIDKKDYEHLRDTYKKQAIKILKEIDRLKE